MSCLRNTQCIADTSLLGHTGPKIHSVAYHLYKHREELWIYLECSTPTKHRIQVTIYENAKILDTIIATDYIHKDANQSTHHGNPSSSVPPCHYPPRSTSYIHNQHSTPSQERTDHQPTRTYTTTTRRHPFYSSAFASPKWIAGCGYRSCAGISYRPSSRRTPA